MGYTSTNALGRTHFQGALVAGGGAQARNRVGIALEPSSTSGTPTISAVGDADDVSVTIEQKGAGTVTIGNSSAVVSILGSAVSVGSSGTGFSGILRGASTFLYPALAASAWGASTVTAPGVSTGSVVMVQAPSSMSTAYIMTGAYVSAANEITVGFLNNVGSSQGSGYSTSDVLRWAAINF
jgi:hypothetical protein